MSARILLITAGHLCRNPRVVKEAQTLAAAGDDVTVLYVRHHPAFDAFDEELVGHQPYRCEAVDLRPGAGLAAFSTRLSVWLARRAAVKLGRQTARALGPFDALLRRARAIPAELTIVHNEVAHAVGLRLRAEGRTVGADIEDWHSEDLLPHERQTRPLMLLRTQERRMLHEFAYATTTSNALADALHSQHGGKRPHVITNSFPLQPRPRTHLPALNEAPAFLWYSQTIGPGRGLEHFLSAWTRTAERSRLVLLGQPVTGYRETLLTSVSAARREQIHFLDWVAPGELPSVIAQHDIGLALEDGSIPSRNFTITNKILQYLNAGLAVVASDTAGQREVMSRKGEAGVLLPLADTAAATAALDTLLRHRDGLLRRQRAARQLAEEVYCWEREGPRLLALVNQVVLTGSAPRAAVVR